MELGFKKAQEIWLAQATVDAQKNCESRYQQGRGPCNIFILDTSSSIGEEGFRQMKSTFSLILDEYANHPDIDENVAVIACGRNTRYHYYYSNRYMDIKRSLDELEFGGLSPLVAAFFLSFGATKNGAGHTARIGNFHVRPRVILFSDGKPTDFTRMCDEDDSIIYERDEEKGNLHQLIKDIGRVHPVFCVPVGNKPDLSFLEFISACSRGGKVVYPHEARQLGKYTKNMRTAALISTSMKNGDEDRETVLTLLASASPDMILSELDKDDILDICTKRSAYVSIFEIFAEYEDDNEDGYYHERNPLLPCLGTRVKRGPHWRWGDQDSNGPGTVIGHSLDGRLMVEWDTGEKNYYCHDIARNINEVSVCNEPRILDTELIAPGCLVTRGPDWEWGDQDGGEGSVGTVYRVRKTGRVHVRWSNGEKCDYRFGQHGKFDIFVCDPLLSDGIQLNEEQIRTDVSDNLPTPTKSFLKIEKNWDTPSFENTLSSSFHLKTLKGHYFKNDRVPDPLSDLEVDGLNDTALQSDQWMWRDSNGKWIPYPRKINQRINECFKRQSKSTVIVSLNGTNYRVVMAKRIQINLESRETTDIKLIKNE
ncbi:uncharacterized protein LOC133201061 [Saccostrea echinata]|uniref:uncharacterized protein LOC133201061 n=1 Tax=Saccostrea echinata TaxID=191078 RepID=UPI002A82888C|nr:uncharacterized protein LOC133201061 [Saccostrea echinata]